MLGDPAANAPQRRKTGWRVTWNASPESGACAAEASEAGTPRCVASKVSAHPDTARTRAQAQARAVRSTDLPDEKGARLGTARPKGSESPGQCEPRQGSCEAAAKG